MTDEIAAAVERIREFLSIVPIGRPHVGEGCVVEVSGLGGLTIADLRTLIDALDRSAIDAEPRCGTCCDTGTVEWMVESDPHGYQEPDSEGRIPCPDCTPDRPLTVDAALAEVERRIREAFRGEEFEENAAAAGGEGEWQWFAWLAGEQVRAYREAVRRGWS